MELNEELGLKESDDSKVYYTPLRAIVTQHKEELFGLNLPVDVGILT